jgi:hypothetical protein
MDIYIDVSKRVKTSIFLEKFSRYSTTINEQEKKIIKKLKKFYFLTY